VRVLFVSTSMGLGGADQQLLSGARGLLERGHQVFIVSLTPLGEMGLQARNSGIPILSLEMSRGIPDPRGLLQLARLIRRWKPDVVHSHMVHANLMARAVRLLAPVPALVSTIHNIDEGGRALMVGYQLSNRLVDHMTIVSQAAADRFIRERIVPGRLLTVLPNGIDTDRFRVPPGTRASLRQSLGIGQEFVWIAVGRFEVAKDYPNMIAAYGEVHRRHPDAVLLVVGRGSLQSETEALVRAAGLERVIRFIGVRHDVPELMSAADGYVMSSAWEGMPIVLLEAASAGLPIVATAVGGNQEVVRADESGYLVPPRDSAALAAAMLRLMELPESVRRALGERGQEYVRSEYSLDRVVDRWEALYREVLDRKGLSPADGRRADPSANAALLGGGQR
jgi:glycosyltransferase involved in cell wall biosynthesis